MIKKATGLVPQLGVLVKESESVEVEELAVAAYASWHILRRAEAFGQWRLAAGTSDPAAGKAWLSRVNFGD
jgi:hypothetical protein